MGKRRKDKIRTVILLVCISVSAASCRHEAVLDQNVPEICFERDILPIFRTGCSITGCHDGTGESHYVFDNYIDISHSVVPGKPQESPAYKAVITSSGEGRMPPDQPLSLESRTLIRFWILQGANPTSCQDPSEQPPGYINPRACFQRDILPALVSGCSMTGCHDAVTHSGGYTYASYSTTMASVRPGSPAESKLYTVITATGGEDDRMPPAPLPPLSAAVIDSIAAWIGYGAPDEFCGEVCDTLNPVTFSGVIWPVIQTSCIGCHGATNPGGSVRLTNYSDVASAASGGVLMNALKGTGVPKMPPAGSLSACRIRQFALWIKNGSPNN